jgi:hypothetical protein
MTWIIQVAAANPASWSRGRRMGTACKMRFLARICDVKVYWELVHLGFQLYVVFSFKTISSIPFNHFNICALLCSRVSITVQLCEIVLVAG